MNDNMQTMSRFALTAKAAKEAGDEAALKETRAAAQAWMRELFGIEHPALVRLDAIAELGDPCISATAGLSALYLTSHFTPFATLAQAMVDDLAEIGAEARRCDILLDTVEPDGQGFFLRSPGLADPAFLAMMREEITKPATGPKATFAQTLISKLEGVIVSATDGKAEGFRFAPFTLAALAGLTDQLRQVHLAAVKLAASGNLRTARALLGLHQDLRAAAVEGEQMTARTGMSLFYTVEPAGLVALAELDRIVQYALEHGSAETYDTAGGRVKLHADLAGVATTMADTFPHSARMH